MLVLMGTSLLVVCVLVDELKAALCAKQFLTAKAVVAKLSDGDARFPSPPTKDDPDAWALVSQFATTRLERLRLEAEQRELVANQR
jgi:hypothetical protein